MSMETGGISCSLLMYSRIQAQSAERLRLDADPGTITPVPRGPPSPGTTAPPAAGPGALTPGLVLST